MSDEDRPLRDSDIKSRDTAKERHDIEQMIREKTKVAWDRMKEMGPTQPEL